MSSDIILMHLWSAGNAWSERSDSDMPLRRMPVTRVIQNEGFCFFIREAQFLFNIGYTVYNDRLTQSWVTLREMERGGNSDSSVSHDTDQLWRDEWWYNLPVALNAVRSQLTWWIHPSLWTCEVCTWRLVYVEMVWEQLLEVPVSW